MAVENPKPYRRTRPPPFRSSHAGGVRGFTVLYRGLSPSARQEVCKQLAQTEESLFSDLRLAVDRRDIKMADETIENLKWARGSEAETCER